MSNRHYSWKSILFEYFNVVAMLSAVICGLAKVFTTQSTLLYICLKYVAVEKIDIQIMMAISLLVIPSILLL